MPIKIILADDHPMILQGTKSFLENLGYTNIELCSNGTAALKLIENNKADIAILDINMPEMSGIEVAKRVQTAKNSCKIILLTIHNEKEVYKKAMEYGVYGYLLKNFSSDEIDKCIKVVTKGEKYSSPHLNDELQINESETALETLNVTERKIVELIAEQKSNKQIGDVLFMSERTVEWHRRNIIEKLNLPKEKNSLLTWAIKNF